MKKILFLLLAATFALCSCTKQDLDEIRAEQAGLDARLSTLEEWQRTINGQITSLQNIFSALEDNDYVTGVRRIGRRNRLRDKLREKRSYNHKERRQRRDRRYRNTG